MRPYTLSPSLRRFPWASLGRRETPQEFERKCRDQRERAELFADAPKFSIVLVPCDTSAQAAEETRAALREQSYPHVEIVDNVSEATGDWIGFVRLGDVLSPASLFQLALEAQQHPLCDVLYTNEVTVDAGSKTLSQFLSKAEFSPFSLWHFNAIGSFWVMRRKLFARVGECATEHERLLKAAEETDRFRHVPFYFYHRREGSPVAFADESAVQASLERQGFPFWVRRDGERVKVTPALPEGKPKISAIICFRDKAEWTIEAARALVTQRGELPLELILVDNDSSSEEVAKVAAFLPTLPVPTKIVAHPGPFNFARMHNVAVREHASGELLLLLNNDVFLEGNSVLDEWAAWALQPSTGTVGIQLRYRHGAIQHSGIRVRFGGEARLARVGHSDAEEAAAYESREVFASTFAACLVRRSVYESIGGLRELDLANGFGDVAFNFECKRHGLRNLYLGHVRGVHLESASRGMSYEYWEERQLEREYPEILEAMLRSDYGYNRVPGADISVPTVVGQALRLKFRESTTWLNPVKPAIKKLVWSWQQRAARSTTRA